MLNSSSAVTNGHTDGHTDTNGYHDDPEDINEMQELHNLRQVSCKCPS